MIQAVKNIIPGKLLVAIKKRPDQLKGGLLNPMHMSDSNEYHAKYGTVLAVAEDEKEILVGDKVFFHYLAVESAYPQASEGLYFEDEDAMMMLREDLFFIERDGINIPLNNFALISPVENKKIMKGRLLLPEKDWQNVSLCEGIVQLIGENEDGIKAGDLIVYEEFSDAPIEYPLTATMDTLYRMPIEEIVGTLNHKLT